MKDQCQNVKIQRQVFLPWRDKIRVVISMELSSNLSISKGVNEKLFFSNAEMAQQNPSSVVCP